MLPFRAIVLATLMGTMVLSGSLFVYGSQEVCDIKGQSSTPSYNNYAVTQQLHDSLNNMSEAQRDSISNLAADTISDEETIKSQYGYIAYSFAMMAKTVKAVLGIYC